MKRTTRIAPGEGIRKGKASQGGKNSNSPHVTMRGTFRGEKVHLKKTLIAGPGKASAQGWVESVGSKSQGETKSAQIEGLKKQLAVEAIEGKNNRTSFPQGKTRSVINKGTRGCSKGS